MTFPRFRKKNDLAFPLVRVDDRLVHGQVIVGWAQGLELRPVLLVSDRVRADPILSKTLLQLIPEENDGAVLTLAETAERALAGAYKDARAMMIFEAPVDVLKLVRLGVPIKSVTIGGLHFREGREEFLPYVFLSEWDRTTLSELRGLGVKVFCQDLPTTKPVPYEE